MSDSVGSNSTVARRQLSRELKKMRLESGISAEEAAEELCISLATMSRIENGKTSVSVGDTKTMCAMYGRPELADALADLAKASKVRSPYRAFSDVIPEGFDSYMGLEQAAASFRHYEPYLVPGILQTEAYARTIIRMDNPGATDDEIDRRVQLRKERQALLTRRIKTPHQHLIVDEAVLHRPVGGAGTMSGQLDRLLEATDLPNVTLAVVPFTAGDYPGITSSSFVLLDFPNSGRKSAEPTIVYAEGLVGALYSDDQNQVDRYRAAFEGIRRVALSPVETKTAIERAAKEMKKK